MELVKFIWHSVNSRKHRIYTVNQLISQKDVEGDKYWKVVRQAAITWRYRTNPFGPTLTDEIGLPINKLPESEYTSCAPLKALLLSTVHKWFEKRQTKINGTWSHISMTRHDNKAQNKFIKKWSSSQYSSRQNREWSVQNVWRGQFSVRNLLQTLHVWNLILGANQSNRLDKLVKFVMHVPITK